jgi:phosphoglycolate phosphatase
MTSPTLVLDLDGTLVDTASDLVATLNFILQKEGAAPLDFTVARGMVGHGARAMLEAGLVASKVAGSPERVELLFNEFVGYYENHIADTSRPFPGTLDALDRFASAGWTLAVCTNKLESLSRQLLGRLGLADRFAVIAGQDSYGVRKPDPRHLTETIRNAGGSPARTVMVGDSEIDIATAKAAGVPVVAVSFGYSPVPLAEFGPDRVIDDYGALFDAATELLGVPEYRAG